MEETTETKYSRFILLSGDRTDSPVINFMEQASLFLFVSGVLYWVGSNNDRMFHLTMELFSTAVSWALFVLIWNTRNRIVNNGLVFLAISYFFVGLLNLVHLSAYSEAGFVIREYDALEVWMAARMTESFSFMVFPWMFSRRIRPGLLFVIFLASTVMLLRAIFTWDIFPALNIEAKVLMPSGTLFRYITISMLSLSIPSLFVNRNLFDRESFNLLSASIIFAVAAELVSVFYPDATSIYGQYGYTSHFLKTASIFLVYVTLIRKGIKKPFSVLFREIAQAANEISKTRNNCRTILNNQPDQIILHDMENRIIWANKAACDYSGETRKTLSGRSCPEIWGQDTEICNKCSVTEAIKNGVTGSTVIKTPDGHSWNIRSCPIHDESGGVTQIIELRENITDRLRAEEKLRLSEINFRRAFNNSSSIMMSITDIETGVFHEVNKAFINATGYSEQELTGKSSIDVGLIDADSRKKMLNSLSENGKCESINIRFRKKNGKELNSLFTGEVVIIDGQKRMLTIAQDMTDFFRTKNELEKEKALLQAVFESTRDFFILKDRDSIFRKVNPAFCSFMGMEENQVTGKNDYDLHPEPTAEKYILEDRKVIETGRSSCHDRRLPGQNETIWAQVVKTPVFDSSGKTTGILCSIRDVSERKQMEKLLKARLGISEFSLTNSISDILQKALYEAELLTESAISFFHFIEYDHDSVNLQSWCLNSLRQMAHKDQKNITAKNVELIECVKRRSPAIHNNYLLSLDCDRHRNLKESITRDMIVPVFEGDRITAILGVCNKRTDYTARDMHTATELANMVWDIITRRQSQMDLNESQRTLKTLVDNLPGMAFRCRYDSEWTFRYASDGCFQLTGYQADELVNNSKISFYSLIHPDDKKRLKEEIRSSVIRHLSYETEYRIFHRNSSVRWVWEKGTGTWDESGRIISLEGFVTDITERITAKDMLRHQTSMLQTILDGTPDILILMKPDHTIVSGNKAAYRQLGKKYHEIEGKKCFEIFGRNSRCEKCATDRSLRTKLNTTTERYEPVLDRWYQINTIPVLGEDGKVSMIVEQLQDITDRRENEAELRRLASAIHQVAETIVITDNKGNIKYANPSFEVTTGYRCKDVIGRNPGILKSGKQDESFYRELWKTITSGETWYGRMTNRKKDGTLFTEEASISPVFDDAGRITEFVAVKRDITNELNLEAQLFQAQKMEAIGALAGGIAHDFNNLLFPLLGYAEMLQMDLPEDSSLQDYVLEILGASKRAKALVQQILAFSRQSAQEKTAVRIQGILNEVIRFSRASLPSTITVKTSVDKKCRPVLADPTQIHQVAMNLMTNAFHAMEENGGELFISLCEMAVTEDIPRSSSLQCGIYAHLSVSDTGCGIDPSIQDKIFNPYFTTKEKGKGTGIGLAVVHGIIKSHGGNIELESEPGKGTTFDIFLPCIKDDKKETGRDRFIAVSGGDEKILVVDDEEPVARMLRQMLERAGYSVTIRTSSTEAMQLFRDNPERFDLVITDMTMPGMTGDHLSIEMKKIRPAIPVIICTGFSEKINEDIAKSMGIEGYVFKPVLQNELTGMIREIMNERH